MRKAPPILRCALLAVALSGCKKSAAAPAAPKVPPRFCDQDLSGTWVNSSDRRYGYRLHDHGDTIRGDFFRRSEDGGSAAPDEPMIIELHRTAEALAGLMRTTDRTAGGRSCPIEFGLQVESCAGEALQIVAETEVPIDEECARQKLPDGGAVQPSLVEYSWERESRVQSGAAHPSDGGDQATRH